jgi:hypothetical protein
MATGYGTHSETTYANHGLNMAIPESQWIASLLDQDAQLFRILPPAWSDSGIVWHSDLYQQVTNIDLTGYDHRNTDDGTLYLKIVNGESDYDVELYMDSAMAVADLVASGTKAVDGAVTMAAENDSGLSGTVTMQNHETNSDNVIVVAKNAEMRILALRYQAPDNVFQRVHDQLLNSGSMLVKKSEYLKRLSNHTQLKMAEVYCGLWLIYSMISRGMTYQQTVSMTAQDYKRRFENEFTRPILWDHTVAVTEDDTDDQPQSGRFNFRPMF